MIEVKKKLFPVSIIAVGIGAFAISIFNRNKLKNLEDEVKSTREMKLLHAMNILKHFQRKKKMGGKLWAMYQFPKI